jgi:hypothetical protein
VDRVGRRARRKRGGVVLGLSSGLYLLAAAMVLMMGSQVWSAWVLIAEVTE